MEYLVVVVFWCSVSGLAYIYVGYPLLIALLRNWLPMRRRREFQPRTVSVVLAVHNEAANLSKKLDSLMALDHAECLVEILIGSDGSTDDLDAVLDKLLSSDGKGPIETSLESIRAPQEAPTRGPSASASCLQVRLISFAERRGKPSVLNDLIPRCRGEIVLLTDARQDFDRRFLTECLANFADEQVGVVSGELVFRATDSQSTAAEGIGFYWTYEKFLRRSESGFRGVPGATGACYAIRRIAFRPIPDATILDDVAIPMRIVEQDYRCVFEPRAIAYDQPSQSPRQESIRKRRTIAGAAQLVRLYPRWLSPWSNPLWFEFVSHKLLRLLSPVLLGTALLSNLLLAVIPPYGVLLSMQFAFYVAAFTGWWFQNRGARSQLFGPSLMFLTLNLTTAAALWDALRGEYRVTWRKAQAPS